MYLRKTSVIVGVTTSTDQEVTRMTRRNKRSNRRGQSPKLFKHRMPFPDEMRMESEVHESKRPRFEEEESLPVQCPECGQWISNDDLNEDGTCYLCEEESGEEEEELREQASGDSSPGAPSGKG